MSEELTLNHQTSVFFTLWSNSLKFDSFTGLDELTEVPHRLKAGSHDRVPTSLECLPMAARTICGYIGVVGSVNTQDLNQRVSIRGCRVKALSRLVELHTS